MSFTVVDPTTGARVREVPGTAVAEVEGTLGESLAAFESWRRSSFAERGTVLRRVAAAFRARTDEWALLMAAEMGKPVRQGRAEVRKCAGALDYYAEHAERFLTPEAVETEAGRSYVAFTPLGPILSIMPWNFPFWQVVRFAAPALMAGNTVLLKHAPNVPGCAEAIEGAFREALRDAGMATGTFRALYVDNETTERLIDRPEIRAVTLTGSTRAGRAVGARAGGALKKAVLELGGSDPYLVLADADLERAVEACATSRLNNGGQSCIAAKRLIVVDAVREPFERALVERMARARVGDPRDEGTEVGPMARRDLRDALHAQVVRSVEGGARLLLGGEVPGGAGWFYPPTVLTNVGPGIPAYEEELFGPVAAVVRARDEAEAIRIANDTSYGLGGAVFTADRARGEVIARDELEVGLAFVNDFVRSDSRVPFGGVKDSGYGRELASFGIREFVNVKTVWLA